MNERGLYIAWGGLFAVCVFLGAVPEPEGLVKALMVMLSVIFFVPGGILLYRSIKNGSRREVSRICGLCRLSLGLSLLLILANILSVRMSETVGNVLYAILVIVSSPMICGQYWFLSLFLWACLLVAGLTHMPKK